VVEELVAEGGGFLVNDAECLVRIALPLLVNLSTQKETGKKAFAVIRRGQGAVERTIAAVSAAMKN
jgi:hypothetical protein